MKSKILSDLSREIMFEYTASPEMVTLSDWSADLLGLPVTIVNPKESEFGKRVFKRKDFEEILNKLKNSTPDKSDISGKYMLDIKGEKTWCKIIAKAMWSDTEPPEYEGAIGKIIDINDETEEMKLLEEKANLDSVSYTHLTLPTIGG